MSVHTDGRSRTWEVDVDRITWIIRSWAQKKAEKDATSIRRGDQIVSPEFDSSKFASDRETYFTRRRADIFRVLRANGNDCLARLSTLMTETESLQRQIRGIYSRASRQALELVDERVRFGERGLSIARFVRDASVTVLCTAAAGAQGVAIGTRLAVAGATSAGAGASDYSESHDAQHAAGTAALTWLSAIPGLELGASATRSVKAALWVVNTNRSIALSATAGVVNGDRPDAALRASVLGEAFSQATGSLPDMMTQRHQLLREIRGETGDSVLVFMVGQLVGNATGSVSNAVGANITRVRQQPSPPPNWLAQATSHGSQGTAVLTYETEESRFRRRLADARTRGRERQERAHGAHKRFLMSQGILRPLDN